MGNFRYEDHLGRHTELLREREQIRLIELATEGRQVESAKRLKDVLLALRIRIIGRATTTTKPTLKSATQPIKTPPCPAAD
jgi:hypothetical protein